jgi:hypothetical protein
MYHHTTTIFNQLLHFVPKERFQSFVGQHQADRYTKSLTTWNQFVVLLYAQATGKDSLREIETGLRTHQNLWYHLGLKSVARSTLADANERRSFEIYRHLFGELLARCKEVTPASRTFAFTNPLYALDSTTITLCLSLFNWAHYSRQKGALKLHTLLDIRTAIPEIVTDTHGKISDVQEGRAMDLSTLKKGSILVMDRGYCDYAWWQRLSREGLYFVTRPHPVSVVTTVLGTHTEPDLAQGILSDERIKIGTYPRAALHPDPLRLVTYHDKKKDETFQFLTNNWELPAATIAYIYKERWQIEIFFKWIKQHLKIKTFMGTSHNAVLTQVWIALIYYLLLAYIKFQTKYGKPLLELTRIVKETLLLRRPLIDLLSLTKKTVARLRDRDGPQMALF